MKLFSSMSMIAIAVGLLVAASAFAQQPQQQVVVTAVGSPTITKTNVTPGGATTETWQYVATFNINLSAITVDATFGLPAAVNAMVNKGSFTVFKNGAADSLVNYAVAVNYSAPMGTTVKDNNFTLAKSSVVTVPVSISFSVKSPGANTYGIRLDRIFWSSSAGKQGNELVGAGWATVGAVAATTVTPIPPAPAPIPPAPTPTPTVPETQIPPEIRMLMSKADMAAYLAATAREVEVYMNSAAQVGDGVHKSISLRGPATERSISEAVKEARLVAQLSSLEEDVHYTVVVHNADYGVSMYANDSRRPVNVKGGYELSFKLNLRLNTTALVLAKGLRSVKISSLDQDGRVTGVQYLQVTENGFYFPVEALGKVLLEVTGQSGEVAAFDLRKGVKITSTSIASTTEVYKENVESVFDKSEINLIPFVKGGVGENVLGEIELTRPTTVSVAGMTTEGAKAASFRYRQIDPQVTTWMTVQASNGIVRLDLSAGHWQVIAVWPQGALTEPIFIVSNGGKG